MEAKPTYREQSLASAGNTSTVGVLQAQDCFRMPDPGPIHFLRAVNLRLGSPQVLSDAGLYLRACRRQPSGGSIGAIVGSCIEGNRRARGSLMNSVDDDFE